MQDLDVKARQIRLVIFDVDGVLTDGSLYYTREGERLKRFHVRDGRGAGTKDSRAVLSSHT